MEIIPLKQRSEVNKKAKYHEIPAQNQLECEIISYKLSRRLNNKSKWLNYKIFTLEDTQRKKGTNIMYNSA